MSIKENPFSERMKDALETVREVTNPDYLIAPVEPTADMIIAGATAGEVNISVVKDIYFAMLYAHSTTDGSA